MREIAHRARVNEVTVFRLFGSKKELYLRVFEENVGPEFPSWISPVLNSGKGDRITFSEVADHLQELSDPMFTRLVFFAALEKPELVRRSLQPRIERFYELLRRHINERVHQGALRAVESDISAQALVALIFYPRVFNGLLLNQDQSADKLKSQIKCYIDIWLHGVTSNLKP